MHIPKFEKQQKWNISLSYFHLPISLQLPQTSPTKFSYFLISFLCIFPVFFFKKMFIQA